MASLQLILGSWYLEHLLLHFQEKEEKKNPQKSSNRWAEHHVKGDIFLNFWFSILVEKNMLSSVHYLTHKIPINADKLQWGGNKILSWHALKHAKRLTNKT